MDRFIHIFPKGEDYAPPVASYKIDQFLKLKRKDNKLELERVPEKRGGVLGILRWNTKVEPASTVVFAKKDNAEEAWDYIRKLV